MPVPQQFSTRVWNKTQQPDGPLFHYTDAWGFDGIVRDLRVRATHTAYLNDTAEITVGQKVAEQAIREVRNESAGTSKRHTFDVALSEYTRSRLTGWADV